MKTPVAFLIFNRLDTTEKVFEAIRQAKPPLLLVVADGPRAGRPGEEEKCAAVRAVIDRVDWDCEVLKNYADVNMGCERRVSSGLDWIFDTVEEAIILEDDCLPHPTFFKFCEELLEKYRNDERVMSITGTNLLKEWKSDIQSYHFSLYGHIWGWATWKRAWDYYDVENKLWSKPEVRNRVKDAICDRKQYQFLNQRKFFEPAHPDKKSDLWDHQWAFAHLLYSGLSIVPSVNLVSNIGFTEEGTHAKKFDPSRANLPLESMDFPLRVPLGLVVDRGFDFARYEKFWKQSLSSRIIKKSKSLLSKVRKNLTA